MRALAAAFATAVLATPPLRRKAKRKFFTFSSNFPKGKDGNSMNEDERDFSIQLIFIIQCAIIWIPKP